MDDRGLVRVPPTVRMTEKIFQVTYVWGDGHQRHCRLLLAKVGAWFSKLHITISRNVLFFMEICGADGIDGCGIMAACKKH
jgi:hypothetical protein